MKISTQKLKTGNNVMLNKVGIFSASLLAASAAVYFYSPVIGTHASTNAEVDISASVNPVASLTLDTTSVSYSFNPTAAGVFESKPVTATVNTNSTGGYELYFSSVDNDTAMTHASLSNTIASDFSGTVTSSTMAANKWGYSLDNTDFSAIPALSSQATIKNLDHLPSAAERDTTVNVGIKIDSTLPSGLYSKSVIFSVLAHESQSQSGSTMQSMQEFDCDTIDIDDTVTLYDARDDNEYGIFKSKDGKCWMNQNLRIKDIEISSADSDITGTFTIPDTNWGDSLDSDAKYTNAYVYDSENDDYGVYYNYVAATAGTITGTTNYTESTESICPKGWKMPSLSDWTSLYNSYDITNDSTGVTNATSTPVNFVYGGYMDYDYATPIDQGDVIHYWSSTSYEYSEGALRYRAYAGYGYAYPDSRTYRRNGDNIRCLTR